MKLTLKQAQEMMDANNGNLDLWGKQIESLPDGLVVPGYLDLRSNSIKELPDGLTVGGSLDLCYANIAELPKGLKVGGSLCLANTKITSLPEDLVVPGDLVLDNAAFATLPENMTVGGYLDLWNTKITELPESLTVGRGIICDKSIDKSKVKRLQDGDYVEGKYLYCDRMLTAVKKTKKVGDYTLYVGKIPGKNVVWDGEYYAHCKTFREGIADILYKRTKDRGADQYKSVTLDTEMAVPELVAMYRVITGACKQGSEAFVASIKDLKEKYTVREAIELTKDQYNATAFEEFFLR